MGAEGETRNDPLSLLLIVARLSSARLRLTLEPECPRTELATAGENRRDERTQAPETLKLFVASDI